MLKQCIKLSAVALLLVTFDASASDETNQGFYDRCQHESFDGAGSYCSGPFEVFLQAAQAAGKAGMFCPPAQAVSMQTYANDYFRWVENNPKYRDEDFFQGINRALSKAYPCKQQ